MIKLLSSHFNCNQSVSSCWLHRCPWAVIELLVVSFSSIVTRLRNVFKTLNFPISLGSLTQKIMGAVMYARWHREEFISTGGPFTPLPISPITYALLWDLRRLPNSLLLSSP